MKAAKKIIAVLTSVILFVLMAPISVFAESSAAEANGNTAAAISPDFFNSFRNIGSINSTVLIVSVIFLVSLMVMFFTFPSRKKRKSNH